MGTVVTVQIVGSDNAPSATTASAAAAAAAGSRARDWFQTIEHACNRFDETSELRRLCAVVGTPVVVSDVLFEAVQFALAVAGASDGAFDPTVGLQVEARGFDRDYRTGVAARSRITMKDRVSYRDVELDTMHHTITLHQPLLLDLGAVAKGLAIDLAARELRSLQNFMVDAGGDLYLGGHNSDGDVWNVGIRHPRAPTTFIQTRRITNAALCTSGDYERVGHDGVSHIMDARANAVCSSLASVSVTAASAMVADALATAAFALGPHAGLKFLARHEVDALLITPTLEQYTTPGWNVD